MMGLPSVASGGGALGDAVTKHARSVDAPTDEFVPAIQRLIREEGLRAARFGERGSAGRERMIETSVVIARAPGAEYPATAPFHPAEAYPEYPFGDVAPGEANAVYATVRKALRLAGLDAARFGTPQWNPLGEFIRPGQFVLLKPNLVKEYHPRDPGGWIYTITHGSVIRAVTDYVWKALEGRGRVMIADAPQTDSDFPKLIALLQLEHVREFYRSRGLGLEIADLRREVWRNLEEVIVDRRPLPGDPNGSVAFDLADRSEFHDHGGGGRYYGADYDDAQLNSHHTGGKHEYLLSASAVRCDVFINLPKLKTHKKAGITVNLKNLVGVNSDKNWLPHHTVGTPRDGGDQYPKRTLKRTVEHHSVQWLRKVALAMPAVGPWLLRRGRRAGKRVFGDTDTVVRSGNWFGNDTIWRMCLDLNKLVLYGNADGTLRAPTPEHRKTYLSFVDGIIAGQGNGPMNPDPLDAGVLLFGRNPAGVDAAAAVIMGFDPERLPIVRNAYSTRGFPLIEGAWRAIECVSDVEEWNGALGAIFAVGRTLRFRAHFGWIGHVEAAR
jgi:uncharacterized protein (DUF362 family)